MRKYLWKSIYKTYEHLLFLKLGSQISNKTKSHLQQESNK